MLRYHYSAICHVANEMKLTKEASAAARSSSASLLILNAFADSFVIRASIFFVTSATKPCVILDKEVSTDGF